jgi:hypothetical protein
LKNIFNRVISSIVMRPFLYAFLFIASVLEGFLSLIDHVFHTRIIAPKISVEEVEQLIQARLPIGTTLDKALEFLDEQKYACDHAVITDSARWNQRISPQDYKIAAVQPAIRKMVIAWIHKNGGGLLVSWETQICLFFDDNDQLLTYLVEVFSIGL